VPVEKTMAFGCSIKWADKRDSVKAAFASWAREEVSLTKIDSKGVGELVKNNTSKLRLINVWATWSEPSVKQIEQFVIINRMYRRLGLIEPLELKKTIVEYVGRYYK